jgi:hypothetical protein
VVSGAAVAEDDGKEKGEGSGVPNVAQSRLSMSVMREMLLLLLQMKLCACDPARQRQPSRADGR